MIIRSVWLMLCFVGVVWGTCSGDCAMCHFRLDYTKDKRHIPMRECKTCHTEEKMSQVDMGGGCGKDCFACHDVQKVRTPKLADSHKIIDVCMDCHKSLSQSLFNPTSPTQNIFEQSIKDFSRSLTPSQDSQ
ncbi:cytochrome c3 family protein [uncultured Helicobacter sp.]|uniref:cytochrome c3 family protein n=1 Tax=uncultured Helicobacter sp. TaxID=175537 RepID=UPI00374E82B6